MARMAGQIDRMDMQPSADPFGVTSIEALESLYDTPTEIVRNKVGDRVDAATARFIAASPFVLLATQGSRGIHVTPRGDPAGFVEVADPHTLILPDRRGNNRIDGLRDIIENDRVGLLFLVPGCGETLRVHGHASITTDPTMRARHMAQGKLPASLVVVRVTSLFMQCAKAVMRSRLWDGRARPEGLPSMGQLIASQVPGLVDARTLDGYYPEQIRSRMY